MTPPKCSNFLFKKHIQRKREAYRRPTESTEDKTEAKTGKGSGHIPVWQDVRAYV